MKRFGSLAALLAVVLVASACGRSSGGGSATPTTGGETTTSAGGTAAGPGDFGTLKDVCGPGKNTMSPDQGVTPTAIDVATSSDPGFAGRRGLNQEIFDAGEVFTKWCNAAGGIHGRKIVIHKYDAALFNLDAQIKKACATDFFLVGNGNVFDNNPAQRDRLSCLLPEIPTYMVTIEGRDSDLTVQPVPNKTNEYAVAPRPAPCGVASVEFALSNLSVRATRTFQVPVRFEAASWVVARREKVAVWPGWMSSPGSFWLRKRQRSSVRSAVFQSAGICRHATIFHLSVGREISTPPIGVVPVF